MYAQWKQKPVNKVKVVDFLQFELLGIDPKPSDLIKGRPMWAEPVYVAKY